MFARVITAQAGAEGFDGTIRLAEQQLPGARQLPGFKGYYLLTGQVKSISAEKGRSESRLRTGSSATFLAGDVID
jgi:hypothetical protein